MQDLPGFVTQYLPHSYHSRSGVATITCLYCSVGRSRQKDIIHDFLPPPTRSCLCNVFLSTIYWYFFHIRNICNYTDTKRACSISSGLNNLLFSHLGATGVMRVCQRSGRLVTTMLILAGEGGHLILLNTQLSQDERS